MSHFFVSYAHDDTEHVREILAELEKRKYPIWFDERLDIGDRWTREISKAISDSTAILLMMTPHSAHSEWVEAEVLYARKIKRPVLPIMLADLSDDAFWYLFPLQYEDARKHKPLNNGFFAKLAQMLHAPVSEKDDISQDEAITIAETVKNEVHTKLNQQEAMTQYLIQRAKSGLIPVTYAELANQFNISLSSDTERYQYSSTLGRISTREYEKGHPLLSAIVVKAGELYPGKGFYHLARNLKPEYIDIDDYLIYAMELKAVEEYWQSNR